jgi:hypothetical protein
MRHRAHVYIVLCVLCLFMVSCANNTTLHNQKVEQTVAHMAQAVMVAEQTAIVAGKFMVIAFQTNRISRDVFQQYLHAAEIMQSVLDQSRDMLIEYISTKNDGNFQRVAVLLEQLVTATTSVTTIATQAGWVR